MDTDTNVKTNSKEKREKNIKSNEWIQLLSMCSNIEVKKRARR